MTIALASSGAAVVTAQSRTATTSSQDASQAMASCSVSALQRQALKATPGNDALRNLALQQDLTLQQATWKAQQPTSYRLCVVTLNPLLITITETDVVRGMIRVARQASGSGALKERLESDDWSPSPGLSVEMLFGRLQRALTQMQSPLRPGEPRFVTTASYDPTFGYPVHTYTGPAPNARIADADVTTLIRLTLSPAMPLTPASSGEVYPSPRRGRIVDPLQIYASLLGLGSPESDAAIRTLWPALANTILTRANTIYWKRHNWTPRAGMEGTVLGTFKHPSGRSIYLMGVRYNNETLYLPIAMNAVAVSR